VLLIIFYFCILAVALTQTSKKTRDQKAVIVQEIRNAIDMYSSLYLFSYENMRSQRFKNIRMDFRESDNNLQGSRIVLGKNKLLQIALGRTSQDEYADNLQQVAKHIHGSVGLLFTNKDRKFVVDYFDHVEQNDFARAGYVTNETVVITQDMLRSHPVSMVEQFRKLGLPVEVQNGQVAFYGGKEQHVLCKKGTALSAEASKLLVHFGIKLAKFQVTLVCVWSNGEFEEL